MIIKVIFVLLIPLLSGCTFNNKVKLQQDHDNTIQRRITNVKDTTKRYKQTSYEHSTDTFKSFAYEIEQKKIMESPYAFEDAVKIYEKHGDRKHLISPYAKNLMNQKISCSRQFREQRIKSQKFNDCTKNW